MSKEKLKKALEELDSSEIWRSSYAPPIYRLIWKVGFTFRPPHYSSFVVNFLFTGTVFGFLWSLIMFFGAWFRGRPHALPTGAFILGGVIFGFLMAVYFNWSAKRNNLTPWENLGE